jgi:regulator of nonsense transcripts 2
LLNLVPLSILGFTHEQAEALRSEWDAKQQEQKIEEDQELPNPDQASRIEEEMAAATQEEVATDDIDTEIAEENESEKVAAPGPVLGTSADGPVPTGDDATNSAGAAGEENRNAKLNQLLTERLLECIQKNKTDEFTVSFCYASNNSKAARKRLVTAIAKIPRSRPELAPNYARIVASLARLYPDMVPPLVEMLKKEFYFVIKHRKSSLHVDHKVKTIRLLSELMKFRLTPPIVLLKVFKSLLLDLTPHHIEMLTVGLETCGRFLYLLPYTKDSMETLLEMLVRLRRAKNLDLYHQTLLDSAYFAVKPPEKKAAANKKAKERSLLEQYIRHLIIDKLDIHDNSTSIDQVIKSCRRLPWNQRDVHVEEYLLKASLKLARTKYVTIPNLADCLSGLAKYYPNTITAVVDVCLEEIQRSLEIPYKREIQRILGYTRLVGELYNFTAIPSTIIFDLLYHLSHYGHGNWGKLLLDYPQSPALQSTVPPYLLSVLHASGIPPTNPLPATTQISGTSNNAANPNPNPSSAAASSVSMGPASVQIPFIPSGNTNSPIPINYFDPRILSEFDLPTDLFRAQIVCELLNTCGDYYVRGVLKERLGKFLVYFQRYLLTKQMIPLHIEFCILDTFDYLEEQARESFLESMPPPAQPAPVTAAFSKKKKSKAKQLAAMEAANSRDNVVVPVSFPRYDNFEAVQRVIEGWEANLLAQQRAEPGAMSIGQAATMDEEEELLIIEEKRNAVRGDEEDLVAQPNGSSNAPAPAAAGKGEEEDSEDSDDEEEDDDDDSSSDDSDDDDSEEGEELNEDLLDVDEEEEEEAAAKLLEKMRIVEEDEEFERQFKSAVQVPLTLPPLLLVLILVVGEHLVGHLEVRGREQDGHPK